jgi:tetratricopeptide (TPR) repeat protein
MKDLSSLHELERGVTLHRRKGDALARRGHHEDARKAYDSALSFVANALDVLELPSRVDPATIQGLDRQVAAEAAEWLGVQGGILRRLSSIGDPTALWKALESYRTGARIEADHNLPQTYDRANAVKVALIAGDTTIAGARDELTALRDVLEERLATDEVAADDGWLWADLGDACLLLGDVDGAASAYSTFAAKARTDSPVSTLTVLREVVDALEGRDDPDAARTAESLETLELMLGR